VVRPLTAQRVFFPGLDGLRFIAALSVLVQHVVQFQALFGFGAPGWFHRLFLTGRDGVILFFVLSGFLITYLLVEELGRLGSIDIGRFYMRRILRIWPLYFLVLVIAVALYAFGAATPGWRQPDGAGDFILYALLLANVVAAWGTPALGVSQAWSIGVEEQFYLVWPAFLLLFARRLLAFTITFVLLKVVLLWVLIRALGEFAPTTVFVQQLALESMAIGAIGAVLVYRRAAILRLLFHPVAQLAALAAFALVVYDFDGIFGRTPAAATTLLSLVFVLVILNVGCNEWTLLRIGNPVTDYLGRISYGIYMLHPVLLYGIFFAVRGLGWNPGRNLALLAAIYIVGVGASIAVAAFSYAFFEAPFLRLKKRFARVESGGDDLPVGGLAGAPAAIATPR
jgi:peptidoglycan/LPS O-acetylase OafA/YrhL